MTTEKTTICDNQLSTQQFQKTLYTWLEDKGLISDLRKYLRVQMIQQLRYSTLNKLDDNFKLQKIEHCSLKEQAFNLLIGEYLLCNGYYYALSVFSIEAPTIVNQLPVMLCENEKRTELWKFDCDTIDNILELIGIRKDNNSDCDNIRKIYLENPGKSLLYCVIANNINCRKNQNNRLENGENLLDYFNRFLSNYRVPETVILDFSKNVQQHIFRDIEKIHKYHQKRYDELIKDLAKKDEELHRIIVENLQFKNEQKLLKQQISGRIEKCEQQHCQELCKINIETIKQLRNEIDNLHDINNRKLIEIEKLSMKINVLEQDLNNSQIKIGFLNNCLQQAANFDSIPDTTVNETRPQSPISDDDVILKQIRHRLEQLQQEHDYVDTQFKQLRI